VQYASQPQSMVQSRRDQNGVRTFTIPNQSQEISSPKLVNSRGKDVTGGIQPKFMYQSAFPDYYKLVEN
jgi:hypothetical protein